MTANHGRQYVRVICLFLCFLALFGCASREQDHTDLGYRTNEETDVRRRAKIRLELAVNYYQQNQAKIALDEIASALQIDPDFAQAYMMRGIILMEAKQNATAQESFLHALKASPKDPDINNAYGWFLCQTSRQMESFQYFQNAADTPFYASPAKPLQNAGICALSLKDYNRAEQYLMKAVQLDANQPATLYHLAQLYLDKKDYVRANFYSNRLIKNYTVSAEILWLGIKIAHYSADINLKRQLSEQLKKDFPNSIEYSLLQNNRF